MSFLRWVYLLTLVVIIAVLAVFWRNGLLRPYLVANEEHTLEPVLLSIRTADKISDPYKRCVSYPNPRNTEWSTKTVKAFCDDAFAVYPTYSRIHDWVIEENSQKAEQVFDSVIDGYFSGEIPEGVLRFSYYANFNNSTEEVGRLTAKWISLSPQSAHAQTARGLHLLRSGIEARGLKTIPETSQNDLLRLQELLNDARKHFQKAIKYNVKIMPAYSGLITIAQYLGDRELAKDVYQRALAVDPKNYHIRYAYLQRLRPRWGGSHKQMDVVVYDAEPFLKDNPRLHKLRSIALASRGWRMYFLKGDEANHQKVMDWFERALEYAPSIDVMNSAAHTAANDLGDHLRAVELYSQILRFNPGNAQILKSRAYSIARLDQQEWALAEYQRILELTPHDRWTLREYASLLERSGDKEAAFAKLQQLYLLDPSDEWVAMRLAKRYLYDQRHFTLAAPLVERLLAENPENGAAWLLHVDLLQNTGGSGLREAVEKFIDHADLNDEEQRLALGKAKAWLERN